MRLWGYSQNEPPEAGKYIYVGEYVYTPDAWCSFVNTLRERFGLTLEETDLEYWYKVVRGERIA